MGTFFDLRKVKKSTLSEEAHKLIQFNAYEDLDQDVVATDIVDDNDSVVDLGRLERRRGEPDVLRSYFLSKGLSHGPYGSSMFMSEDFFRGLIKYAEDSTLYTEDSARESMVERLNTALTQTDFESEYLFFTYW